MNANAAGSDATVNAMIFSSSSPTQGRAYYFAKAFAEGGVAVGRRRRRRSPSSEVAPIIGKLEITVIIIRKPVKDTSMRNGAPRKVPLDPDGRTNGEVLQIMLMPMEILRWCVLNADAAKA